MDFEEMVVSSRGNSATPRPLMRTHQASLALRTPIREIKLISNDAMHRVSEIKLIRTDTTLDLSQKAEKVCLQPTTPMAKDSWMQFYPEEATAGTVLSAY